MRFSSKPIPTGGVLAVRYGLGREPGLVTLAASRGADVDLLVHAQRLPGGTLSSSGPSRPSGLPICGVSAVPGSLHARRGVDRRSSSSTPVGSTHPRRAFGLADSAAVVGIVCRPAAEQLIPAADVLSRLERADACAGTRARRRPAVRAGGHREPTQLHGPRHHRRRSRGQPTALATDGGRRGRRRSQLLSVGSGRSPRPLQAPDRASRRPVRRFRHDDSRPSRTAPAQADERRRRRRSSARSTPSSARRSRGATQRLTRPGPAPALARRRTSAVAEAHRRRAPTARWRGR